MQDSYPSSDQDLNAIQKNAKYVRTINTYSLNIFLLAHTKRELQVDYSIVQAVLYSIAKEQINMIVLFPTQQLTACVCPNSYMAESSHRMQLVLLLHIHPVDNLNELLSKHCLLSRK